MPARKERRPKTDQRGRRRRERSAKFTQIFDWERRSAAWRYLARDHAKTLILYLEFKSYYNGTNNDGNMWLSVDDALRALGGSKSTIHRAFAQLEEIGFLKRNKRGAWFGNRKIVDDGNLEERQGKATTYWITAVDMNDAHGKFLAPATKEFMSWLPPPEEQKPPKRARKKNSSVGTVVTRLGTVVTPETSKSHQSTEKVA